MDKEWKKSLEQHGFGKIKRQTYGRVVGDGLLQIVCSDAKWPLDHEYGKKERVIQYGVWSLYEEIPEPFYYDPSGMTLDVSGNWKCSNLIGKRFYAVPFKGFEEDLRVMREIGFPYLNKNCTHKVWIKEYTRLWLTEYHDISEADRYLAVLYLMNGEIENAIGTLACQFFNHLWALRSDSYRFEKEDKGDVIQDIYKKMADIYSTRLKLWRALCVENADETQRILSSNYQRNMELVKKYRVPIMCNYEPIDLSRMRWFDRDMGRGKKSE